MKTTMIGFGYRRHYVAGDELPLPEGTLTLCGKALRAYERATAREGLADCYACQRRAGERHSAAR